MNPQTRARSILLTIILLSLAAFGFASVARAQEPPAAPAEHGTVERAETADHDPHPVLPEPQSWHGITVILIVSMFLAAAAVGIMVRLNSWDEEIPPPAHSHDEPPGASHHHGRSGTINPEPEDELHDRGSGHGHH